GGTCGDQTYYAAQVGRTLGYPVATIRRDEPGIINHWWCLQLCRVNDEYVWRPAGGEGFGRSIDPATGRVGSDHSLDFLLASLRRGRSRREVAAAMTQVGLRATDWIRAEVPADGDALQRLVTPPGQDDQTNGTMQRYYTVQRRLDPLWLAKQALEADPYNANAWAAVGRLAADDRIDPSAYADLLDELATLTRPDMADVVYFALLEAYANVPPDHRARFLEAARQAMTPKQIERSPQLAGHLYLLAGDQFAAEKEYEKALDRYRAAIEVDPDFRPNLVRSLQRALAIASRTDGGEAVEAAAKRLFARTRDAHFGEEIGRVIESAGLTQKAIVWYRHVFDLSDGDDPGRFDSLRRAIRLLDGLGKAGRAALWSKELYDITNHPDDGQRVVQLLRSGGKNAQAKRFQKLVAENERERQKRVATDAARRAALVR
ncbi:MAG: hypothetical protein GY778_07225, partial [bacterium]|nr:hypothetical protein [bacterium]